MNYDVRELLKEFPFEISCIAKYIYQHDNAVPDKVVKGTIELLINNYIQNASENEIFNIMNLLMAYENNDLAWGDANKLNDFLEDYW